MFACSRIACCAAVAIAAVTVTAAAFCPPTGFDTQGALLGGFDLDWYANGTWHVQQQMVVEYLPKGYTHCVAATYTIHAPTKVYGYQVQVHNHAENAAGEQPSGPKDICGKVVNKTAGKLEVAPCFLPSQLSGPYWIVAFDVVDGWALVSGGPPKNPSGNGTCKTGTGVNGSGLWIFTRMQTRNEAVIQKVRSIALAKGFDLSVLQDINQTSCKNHATF